ncbi:hypothetical protein RI659_29925, partial [Pseudomonas aeruginosa]
HLLHRETRWVGSRYFAKSESLFQSFLNRQYFQRLIALPEDHPHRDSGLVEAARRVLGDLLPAG